MITHIQDLHRLICVFLAISTRLPNYLIAQESPGCHVPIVALTAHDDPDLKARALQAGMDDYRVKPLSSSMAQEILIKYGNKMNTNTLQPKRKKG